MVNQGKACAIDKCELCRGLKSFLHFLMLCRIIVTRVSYAFMLILIVLYVIRPSLFPIGQTHNT